MTDVIDNKVVQMGFDNKNFETNVKNSLVSIDNLKKSLNFESAVRSLSNLTDAGKKFNLTSMAMDINSIANRFSTMGIIGMTVIQNLTNAVLNLGKQIITTLAIKPLTTGLQEYETQINAIQTILANTASKGTTLDQVNSALDQLNEYSDKTIYNFTEMTKNIGTFTAAGVDLETSVSAIKGIANLAAVSGANNEKASRAMYQLSQAIASGTVKLIDWNSVVQADLGGEVFKNALMETARAHDIAIDKMIKKEGSFKDTLQNGWLSSEILLETLSKFTGDLNEEQLKAMGYTDQQIVEIMKLGQIANDAATKVKTFSQLKSTMMEALQSGWSQSWRIIIGDFEEAKKLFTNISDFFGGFINASSQARNQILKDWAKFGGRVFTIDSIYNSFEALLRILRPIKEAFSEVFPRLTGYRLSQISFNIRKLTENLKISGETADRIKRIFKGLFSVFYIVGRIIFEIAKVFVSLLTPVAKISSGSIIDILANFGDYLVNLKDALNITELVKKAFTKLGIVLGVMGLGLKFLIDKVLFFFNKLKDSAIDPNSPLFAIILKLRWFTGAILGIINYFKQLDPAVFTNFFANLRDRISGGLAKIGKIDTSIFSNFFASIKEGFKKAGGKQESFFKIIDGIFLGLKERIKARFGPLVTAIGNAITEALANKDAFFKKIGEALNKIGTFIGEAFAKIDFSKFSFNSSDDIVNGAIFTGIIAIILNFLKTGKSIIDSIKGITSDAKAITAGFKDIFSGVTGTLEAMQQKLRADILMKLAIAIGILTLSVLTLSLINSDKLNMALQALGALVAGLLGSLAIYEKTAGAGGLVKATSAIVMLLGIATAMIALAGVIKMLGGMEKEKLDQGLKGLAYLIGEIVAMQVVLSLLKPSDNQLKNLGAVAISLLVFVKVIKKLGDMDPAQFQQGLIGLGVILALVVATLKIANDKKINPGSGVALILIASALVLITKSVELLGSMDYEVLKQGLQALGAIMLGLAIFMKFTGNSQMLISSSIGIAIVAASMQLFILAIQKLGEMPIAQLEQGLGAFAKTLFMVGIAMNLIPKDSALRAAGLLVAGVAMAILFKVVEAFGNLNTKQINTGLLGLGVSIAILAAGLYAMSGSLPGAAALLIAAGALAILTPVIKVLGSMPLEAVAIALGTIAGVFVILGVAGYLLGPVVPVLIGLSAAMVLMGIASVTFGLGVMFLSAGLATLAVSGVAGALAFKAMLVILLSLIPIIIKAVVGALVIFAQEITKSIPVFLGLVQTLLLGLIELLYKVIPPFLMVLGVVIQSLLAFIRTVTPDIINTVLFLITALLQGVALATPDIVQAGFDILIGILKGIRDNIKEVVTVAAEIITEFIDGIAEKIDDIIASGFNLIVQFISGIADAVSDPVKQKELGEAIAKLGEAVVKGFTDGITNAATGVVAAIGTLAGKAIDALKLLLGIFSPSRVFTRLGELTGMGFSRGIDSTGNMVEDSASSIGNRSIAGINSAISQIARALEMNIDMTPTIRPVVDLTDIISGSNEIENLIADKGISVMPTVNKVAKFAGGIITETIPELPVLNAGNTISLTQNNYSPKPLSRLEIYRMTKNQLLTLKGLA